LDLERELSVGLMEVDAVVVVCWGSDQVIRTMKKSDKENATKYKVTKK
jgi:hypothetical protein